MNVHRKLVRYAGLGAVATLSAALVNIGPANATAYPRSSQVYNRVLQVVGTQGSDNLLLAFSTDGAVVDFNDGSPSSFARKDFDSVAVFLGSGDDQFHVASGPVADPTLNVFGGNGDDVIVGGSGTDALFGDNGDDDIRGGAGVDVLYGDRGDDLLDGGVGTDTEFLGSGADTALWVPGEGSDVVHGGGGLDTLDFVGGTGVDSMVLNANGSQSLFTREPGTIRMDLDSVEALALSPLTGADRLTINGTDADEAVDVQASSGAVTVSGLLPFTTIAGPEKGDQLQINTLGGHDSVDVRAGVSDLITTTFDLGAGQ